MEIWKEKKHQKFGRNTFLLKPSWWTMQICCWMRTNMSGMRVRSEVESPHSQDWTFQERDRFANSISPLGFFRIDGSVSPGPTKNHFERRDWDQGWEPRYSIFLKNIFQFWNKISPSGVCRRSWKWVSVKTCSGMSRCPDCTSPHNMCPVNRKKPKIITITYPSAFLSKNQKWKGKQEST